MNKRVIKPAVNEVNTHSPIRVKPEIKKEGQSVVAIRFLINQQREKAALCQIQQSEEECTITDRLSTDYGLSDAQIKMVLANYGENYILEKLAIIEASSSFRDCSIMHLAKYLEKALEENFQPPKSSKNNLERLKIQREKNDDISKLRQENMQKYRVYQNGELVQVFNALPNNKKAPIELAFNKYISSTLYSNVFLKEGLENVLVRDRFGDFLRKTHSELLASLLSFEDFCIKGS